MFRMQCKRTTLIPLCTSRAVGTSRLRESALVIVFTPLLVCACGAWVLGEKHTCGFDGHYAGSDSSLLFFFVFTICMS